jgi:cell wall-associated NlpC family hydrolase
MKTAVGAVVALVLLIGLGASVFAVTAWYMLYGGVLGLFPNAPTSGMQLVVTLNGAATEVVAGSYAGLGAPRDVPPDQWSAMVGAAQSAPCAIDPTVLAAMAKTESSFGTNMSTSSAGAFGYGQFSAPTWRAYGQGGDAYDYHAALPAMARYLCALGYSSNPARALNAYGGCTTPLCLGNTDYASLVQKTANSLGQAIGQALGGASNNAVTVAQAYVTGRVPYVFGGNSFAGIDCSGLVLLVFAYVFGGNSFAGIDCSGLVQQVYLQLGRRLPRTAADQFTATQRVGREQLQPGDLVFFSNTYMPGLSHVGIYIGGGQMINAPAEGQTVSVMPAFTGYWGAHYAGAGRVV